MSYMRGKYYIWSSGTKDTNSIVHIWVANEKEATEMQQSGWAETYAEDQIMGTALPERTFDELVVMRYAELEKQKKVKSAELRAIERWDGNFGCDALLEKHKKPTSISRLTQDEDQPTKGFFSKHS